MGILYISEYTEGSNPSPTLGHEPSHTQQAITFGASTASAAFRSDTRMVRLHNDATSPCSVRFGTAPVATTGHARLAANQTEYFKVIPGDKVAAITNT